MDAILYLVKNCAIFSVTFFMVTVVIIWLINVNRCKIIDHQASFLPIPFKSFKLFVLTLYPDTPVLCRSGVDSDSER